MPKILGIDSVPLPKDTKSNLDNLTRKEGALVYATDLKKAFLDDGTSLVEIGSESIVEVDLLEDSLEELPENVPSDFKIDEVVPEVGDKVLFTNLANNNNRVYELSSIENSDWTVQESVPGSWRSVCWSPELGKFVAVASGGLDPVMTSPDGKTWTQQVADEGLWRSVCWSPELGLFVAVGHGPSYHIMTSPDGIEWTGRAVPETYNWNSVCWSPELGIFVAVAASGTNRVMVSPDGVTWVPRPHAESNSWLEVCWSPELELFVAVSSDGTHRVMTSPDGETWTARDHAGTGAFNSVCWSPELGIFVAVAASGTNRVMVSPDGINWTARDAAADSAYRSVAWSPEMGIFAAVASSGGDAQIMTSPDGETWTSVDMSAPLLLGICWAPERKMFVAVGSHSQDRVLTFDDSLDLTWTSQSETPSLGETVKIDSGTVYGGNLATFNGSKFLQLSDTLVKGGRVPGSDGSSATEAGYIGEIRTASFVSETITTSAAALVSIPSVTPGVYLARLSFGCAKGSATRVSYAINDGAAIGTTYGDDLQFAALGGDGSIYVGETIKPVRLTTTSTIYGVFKSESDNCTGAGGALQLIRVG